MCKTMVMKMSLATMLLMLISMNGFSQNIGGKEQFAVLGYNNTQYRT